MKYEYSYEVNALLAEKDKEFERLVKINQDNASRYVEDIKRLKSENHNWRVQIANLTKEIEEIHVPITDRQNGIIERALNSMRGIRNEGDKGYYVGSSTIEGWIEILEGK